MNFDTSSLILEEQSMHFSLNVNELPAHKQKLWLKALTSVQSTLHGAGLKDVTFCTYGLKLNVGPVP